MGKQFIGSFDKSMLADLAEFDKRYRDTYLYITLPGSEERLYYYKQVEGGNVIFFNPEVGNIALNQNTEATLTIRWPQPKVFNMNGKFVLLLRLPDRQWKRAPCNKTLKVYDPLRTLFEGHNIFYNLDWDSLTAAMLPTPVESLAKAIIRIQEKEGVGFALNDEWAVSLPTTTAIKQYVLWYKSCPVGLVDLKNKQIKVEHLPMKQEVMDFNRDYEGRTWTII